MKTAKRFKLAPIPEYKPMLRQSIPQIDLDPDRLATSIIVGWCMYPLMWSGDSVLVEHLPAPIVVEKGSDPVEVYERLKPIDDEIFAVRLNGGRLMVKRVQCGVAHQCYLFAENRREFVSWFFSDGREVGDRLEIEARVVAVLPGKRDRDALPGYLLKALQEEERKK